MSVSRMLPLLLLVPGLLLQLLAPGKTERRERVTSVQVSWCRPRWWGWVTGALSASVTTAGDEHGQ